MIKKISLFFSAIAIGILSIFSGITTKNAAEPNYFLENTQIKKAAVETNTNELTIFLDIVNYTDTEPFYFDICKFNSNSELYLINENQEYIKVENVLTETESLQFYVINDDQFSVQFFLAEYGGYVAIRYNSDDFWASSEIETNIKILGFKVTNITLVTTLENINSNITPFIGNLTSLPSEPIQPLDQINTLVSDIVNWFTNIFNGLGNVFYDPTTNKLTAWGTVMFIGVAIMLISMALKWVISLIRGV